jgi:hypothetical protein
MLVGGHVLLTALGDHMLYMCVVINVAKVMLLRDFGLISCDYMLVGDYVL